MLSFFEEFVWYTTIPLVALFAHREYTYEFSTPKYAILTVAAFLTGIYLFYKLLKSKQFKFFATPVHFAWLAFSIIALLSTYNTFVDNRFFFRQAIDIGLYLFLNVLISFYFSSIMNEKDKIVKFLFVFVLTGLFIAINAILNFYTGYDIMLGRIGDPFERASIKANIGNVIFVSNYLNMLLPIALYFVASLDVGIINLKKIWSIYLFKLTALISAILSFDVIVFSQTRSEYLALVIEAVVLALVYFFYLKKKEDNIVQELIKRDPKLLKKLLILRKVAIFSFLIAAILIVIVYNVPTPFNNYGSFNMTDRFSAMASVSSRDERFLSWFSTLYIWKNHKIIGQGIGTYQVYGLYGISDLIEAHPEYNYGWNNFKRAHNDYFQILSETGILGLTAIIVMLILLVVYVMKNVKKIAEKDDALLFFMLVLSGIVFAFQSTFSFPGHLLPNAILANFVISTGLGMYFNKVNGKEYILRLGKGLMLAILLLSIVGASMYLRWNHFISEVYFRKGNVAYSTLSTLRNELDRIDQYLHQLNQIESDLNSFSGRFEQLSPQTWHALKQAEAKRLNVPYNSLQAEAERQKYIAELKNKIQSEREYLTSQKNIIPQQIKKQYELAKDYLLKSVNLNHTYGKSYFYLAALSTDIIRIDELKLLMNSDPEKVLSQQADDYQKLINERFKHPYYLLLANYLRKNPDFIDKVNIAYAQAVIDSISLYELSLQTFTERNTFKTLAMRYASLYQFNKDLVEKLTDPELSKKISGNSPIFFNNYSTWVRKTIDIMPGGWNRFPDWKNIDIEQATTYGQDIYRYFANITTQLLSPMNVEARDLLVDLAKREIKTAKYMELKNVWGVPDGILDHLHALAREYQSINEYQESVYTYQQILEWYKETYEYIKKKITNKSTWDNKYNQFIEESKNTLDKILADEGKGYLSNSLTPIFVNMLSDAYKEFSDTDMKSIEKSYVDEMSRVPASFWVSISKKSVWKTIAQNKMNDFLQQISALQLSNDSQTKITNLANKVMTLNTMFLLERYKRFASHYELIIEELNNTVSRLLDVYKNTSEEEILKDWSEVSFNAPVYKSKQDVIKYLEILMASLTTK
ncbi:MAG: O-antigen ligase family protein [Fervidobacterium sp.]